MADARFAQRPPDSGERLRSAPLHHGCLDDPDDPDDPDEMPEAALRA